MKALSIRQPWAWFILEGYKAYENRKWTREYLAGQLKLCPIGSNVMIHAAKGMTKTEYEEACAFALACGVFRRPRFDDLPRGGLVGMVRLQSVVRASQDRWFTGPLALKFADPYPVPFLPCPGQLGFFDLDWASIWRGNVAAGMPRDDLESGPEYE